MSANDPGVLRRLVGDLQRGGDVRDLVAAAAARARARHQQAQGPGFRELVAGMPDTAAAAAQQALSDAQEQFANELADGAARRALGRS